MYNIFFRIKKTDCEDISYKFEKNGLLEITVPRASGNAEINDFFRNLGAEQLEELADKQKKYKEAFRKKTKKKINKYLKEFDLPFLVDLQLRNQTKKLNDCHVDVHGIVIEGKMLLVSVLQFVSDEIVDKIVRCTVYMLACDYENVSNNMKSITVAVNKFPEEIENISETHYEVPKEMKYEITIPYDEIKKIQANYEEAVKQFVSEMKADPIMSI